LNIALRLLPFFIGVGVVYVLATNIAHLDRSIKFIVASICVLCLGYFFTWFNRRMMQRSGEISENKVLKPNHFGHVLLFFGALVMGYGFSVNGNLFLVIGFLFLWFADDLLTKTVLTASNQDTQKYQKTQTSQPSSAALFDALNEKRKSDPLIGAKIGGKEVFQRLLNGMRNERGVHVDSLLCALGALAGYSCQASLRAQAIDKGLPEIAALVVVDTKIGKKYFFGDPLNQALVESEHSIWSLAGSAAKHNGCKQLPDINAIFKHVSSTIGDETFGIPRFPAGHNASDSPVNFLKALWPALFPVAKQFCAHPSEWPILFGVAIQEAIDASKAALAPDVALLIVMESAVPMSKIDLVTA
jgi:hypothetical protein